MLENHVYLMQGDCRGKLARVPTEAVHAVITDPPYNLYGMGDGWDVEKLERSAARAGVVGGLPVGMKFDAQQGKELQKFLAPVACELYRVLKPGGFCIVFSQARLYHRTAVAFEDAGFEVRDMFAWKYEGQAKAFSQDHFVRQKVARGLLSAADGERLIASLSGRKTPQLKPQLEPMCFAQKPRSGTFIDNWEQHGVGLLDVSQSLDGMFPGNCMQVPKPSLAERRGNDHLTVKPVTLISHLIRLTTTVGQTVLDPFMGSGSHGVAAVQTGRRFIGVELNPQYFTLAERRLREVLNGSAA